MPSPMAVPPLARRASSAVRSCTRSVVGGVRTCELLAKATRPTWKRLGSCSTKCSASAMAADRRVGLTSRASMDPETSITSITVPSCFGSFTEA